MSCRFVEFDLSMGRITRGPERPNVGTLPLFIIKTFIIRAAIILNTIGVSMATRTARTTGPAASAEILPKTLRTIRRTRGLLCCSPAAA